MNPRIQVWIGLWTAFLAGFAMAWLLDDSRMAGCVATACLVLAVAWTKFVSPPWLFAKAALAAISLGIWLDVAMRTF